MKPSLFADGMICLHGTTSRNLFTKTKFLKLVSSAMLQNTTIHNAQLHFYILTMNKWNPKFKNTKPFTIASKQMK